jgi:hypothetical protein
MAESKKVWWYDGIPYQTEEEAVEAELAKIGRAPRESIQQAATRREREESSAVVWRWIFALALVLFVIWLWEHYSGNCNPDSLYGC